MTIQSPGPHALRLAPQIALQLQYVKERHRRPFAGAAVVPLRAGRTAIATQAGSPHLRLPTPSLPFPPGFVNSQCIYLKKAAKPSIIVDRITRKPHKYIYSFNWVTPKMGNHTFMETNTLNRMGWFKTIGCWAFFLLPTAYPGSTSGQGVIISVTGLPTPVSVTDGFNATLNATNSYNGLFGISWMSTSSFSNVKISIELDGDLGATGVAYLTKQIGFGTTTANQIASTSFAFPSTSSLVPVMSGVNLGAGTYYLVIRETAIGTSGDAVWLGTASPSVDTAANINANGEYWNSGTFSSYAPASAFSRDSTTTYDYTVESVPVPEPSVTWLVLLGGGVMIWRRRSLALMGFADEKS
jgi:hypothetical protein